MDVIYGNPLREKEKVARDAVKGQILIPAESEMGYIYPRVIFQELLAF